MEHVADWIALWRELAEMPRWQRPAGEAKGGGDPWAKKARGFDANVKQRWSEPDPVRDFVAARIEPGDSVLDIGAGTGRWALFLAHHARLVTAIDPSPAMLAVLRENVSKGQVENVRVVEGAWPQVEVEPHDVSLCSHAMYACPDFPAFINRMVAQTRRTCFLLVRIPATDGVMADASIRLLGQPHDSPNFVVAYNALMQMGIFAHVLVDTHFFRPWTSESLEKALSELKDRFTLGDDTTHDEYFMGLLRERLVLRDGVYVWPDGMRSALVYWDVDPR